MEALEELCLAPDTQKFLQFAETHRTVLNQILRQSTAHLADGPFCVLVDHTRYGLRDLLQPPILAVPGC